MAVLKFTLAGAGLLFVVAYAVGSGRWVQTSQGWYEALAKPAWQPPPWVFGAVWAYCFLMLAAVAAIVGWQAPGDLGVRAAILWTVLLGVSAALGVTWSWLFYGEHALAASAVALTGCALLTAGLLVIAAGISGWVVAAMVPYQVWLLIATSLSWGYVALNRPG